MPGTTVPPSVPAQPSWGPPPVPSPGTNGWSVAALVTGILPLPPVAIGCAVAGIVQTGRRSQSGRGLAVAGLVLGTLWLLLLGGLVAAGVTGLLDYESQGRLDQVPASTSGTCLREPRGGAAWTVTDCSLRHDAEVYGVTELGEQPWPGDEDLAFQADELCMEGFRSYVGESYYVSDHEYGYFVPAEDEWAAGAREAVCVITPGFGEHLVGSARPDA